jgi:hypothetical protein
MNETKEEGINESKRANVKATPIPIVEPTKEFNLAVKGKECTLATISKSLLLVVVLIKASFIACKYIGKASLYKLEISR